MSIPAIWGEGVEISRNWAPALFLTLELLMASVDVSFSLPMCYTELLRLKA